MSKGERCIYNNLSNNDYIACEMCLLLSIGIGTLTKNLFEEQSNRLRVAQAITASKF